MERLVEATAQYRDFLSVINVADHKLAHDVLAQQNTDGDPNHLRLLDSFRLVA